MTDTSHHHMTGTSRHQDIEIRFRELVHEAGLPAPDECAHLQRALVFLWYASKAIVLLDLEELPDDADPFEGFDAAQLAADVYGTFPGRFESPGPFPSPGGFTSRAPGGPPGTPGGPPGFLETT